MHGERNRVTWHRLPKRMRVSSHHVHRVSLYRGRHGDMVNLVTTPFTANETRRQRHGDGWMAHG